MVELRHPLLLQLVKLPFIEPTEALLLHVVIKIVVWKMGRWVFGYAEAAAVANHWVGCKVRFSLLARGQDRDLGGEAFALETK